MSDRFNQLTAQHGKLRAYCALQRQALGETALEIERQLSGVDRAVNLVRNVARRPALVVGGVAVVALIGPRRVLRWASKSAFWFTTARRLMRLARDRKSG